MKPYINFFKYFLLTTLLGLSLNTFAQEEVVASVKSAFKANNSKEVAKFFNNSLELVIEPESVENESISNTQAELVLRNFFQKYPAKDFNWDGHEGASPAGLKYRTGTYNTSNNKFVVFLVLKQIEGKYLIDRLYIQK
jgi:hypothetical protein